MSTNSIVLTVVAALVALTLVGVVMGFKRKFRAERHLLGGASLRQEIDEDARLGRLNDEMTDELTAKAQAAQIDSGIAAFRSRGRRGESADSREAADMRQQLKDHGTRAD
ncbi:hypothetical protein [Mycolicibacterium hodleri]|uniref:Uncharacterized protein n=1 Tax=Mycolicibacterium hodleri TaxID=49897 RepID=A0A502ECE8_9MYCO|nr:hypothetical protein [Mycolicibacterium hodleri]TPG34166.1 hypothetical protein EAH80_11175 [Mycolicibacterium hodleri]